MRYFIDTEFQQYPVGFTMKIELISIGMVSEDNHDFYAVNEGFNIDVAYQNDFLKTNVLNTIEYQVDDDIDLGFNILLTDLDAMPPSEIRQGILDLTAGDTYVEFWADYGAFDYVILSQLFGGFADWPSHFPMYINDIRQIIELNDLWVPPQTFGQHNAMSDARAVMKTYNYIKENHADLLPR